MLISLMMTIILSWSQFSQHISWKNFSNLSAQVAEGRFVPADLDRITPLLDHETTERCTILHTGVPITLNLYAGDLMANALDINPFHPSDHPDLTLQRKKTQQILHHAITCSPTDGDLWTKLAVTARALGAEAQFIAHYVALSQKYAPNEGWILERRDRLF